MNSRIVNEFSNCKTPRRKNKEKISWNRDLGKNFLDRTLAAQATQAKNRKIGLHHAHHRNAN